MPGAMARRKKRGSSSREPQDDAFLEFVDRVAAWVGANQRTVLAGLVLVALAVGGALYYRSYRQDLEARAATRLQEVRSALAAGETDAGALQQYLDRYGGTRPALEARIVLGRIQLRNGNPGGAMETLGPAAERPVDTPTGYAATMLMASAREEIGDREGAARLYAGVAQNARFAFQRREAAAARARLLVEAGRLREARDIYRRLAEETDGDAAGEEMYELRLGEVEAMLAARDGRETAPRGAGGSGAGDASDAGAASGPEAEG